MHPVTMTIINEDEPSSNERKKVELIASMNQVWY